MGIEETLGLTGGLVLIRVGEARRSITAGDPFGRRGFAVGDIVLFLSRKAQSYQRDFVGDLAKVIIGFCIGGLVAVITFFTVAFGIAASSVEVDLPEAAAPVFFTFFTVAFGIVTDLPEVAAPFFNVESFLECLSDYL